MIIINYTYKSREAVIASNQVNIKERNTYEYRS